MFLCSWPDHCKGTVFASPQRTYGVILSRAAGWLRGFMCQCTLQFGFPKLICRRCSRSMPRVLPGNSSEWLRMAQNGSEWLRMAQNGSEWLGMAQNGSEWPRMAINLQIYISEQMLLCTTFALLG